MMYILLLLSILLGVGKSMAYNQFAKRHQPALPAILGFNAVCYGIAALITLMRGISAPLSLFSFCISAGYALIVFSLQALSVSAMRTGPMALTSLFVLYGMIIPALAGPLFWDEPFGLLQGLGLALMLVSLWLLTQRGRKTQTISRRWYWQAAGCFLLSGGAGLMEKIHQTSPFHTEQMPFLLTAFTLMLLFSLLSLGIYGVKSRPAFTPLRPMLLFGALSGAIAGVYLQVNLTLSGGLDSLIYYPIANGGGLLLTVAVSALFFHEKLHARQAAGFFTGLLAILRLSFPV